MIGDPSGRTDMRQMMTKETIQHNVDCFKVQMSKFIDFSDDKALLVNNADWLLDLNYVEVLREVGACFSVNNMLRAECYKQRMEKGLSFLEFNYMIMQSYDFYALFQKYGCNMQFGGDDQWSNMLGGTELIRRKLGKDAHAMTITLLLNSEGKKMGKTQKGAVWLDPNKTSPFEFYQYWRRHGIGKTSYTDFLGKRARQVTAADYEYYDYILCADADNIRSTIRITGPDRAGKIKLLLDYAGRPGQSIADPWYTGDFRTTYQDIVEGCEGLLRHLGIE